MINLTITIVLLFLAISFTMLLRTFKIPSILGYLCIGLLVGPSGLQLIQRSSDIQHLAEFGIVFLLFTIGLEISLTKLLAMKKQLLAVGGLQVLTCTIIPGVVAWQLGMTPIGALVACAAVALSSTAIVSRELMNQHALHTPHGQLSFAILLFQDLAAIPFLIIIPTISTIAAPEISTVLLTLLFKGIVITLIFILIGQYCLQPIFKLIARTHSSELFMLTVLLVVLGAGWLTASVGLSMVLGAFLGGIMLGETAYRHQIENDIRPFKDILLGLFFITVGMLLDLHVVITHWYWVLFLVTAIVGFKAVIISCIAKWVGKMPTQLALRVGIILAHSGEFSFVLLALAINTDILQLDYGQVVLAGIIITMFLSPFLIQHQTWIVRQLPFVAGQQSDDQFIPPPQLQQLDQHILICGFGRIGQTVAQLLQQEHIRYVAVDNDIDQVSCAVAINQPVYYGNATSQDILLSLGIKQAKLLFICIDNQDNTNTIYKMIKKLNKDLPTLVRIKNQQGAPLLINPAIDKMIPELLDSSFMYATEILQMLGLSTQDINNKISQLRQTYNQML